jgi:eukaryotic-like serine/threonine-protein kinase
VLVPGSDLGRDVAAAELAEQSTRLYQSPEELSSRFDLALLEPSEQPGSLGRLGKCEVLALIGFGGMGVVFRAQDQHLLRNVAIKVMSRDLATSDTARRRFIREARAAAAINHPNVVTIHSVDEHTPFLVMELLDGESLRDRLRHRPKLELLDVLNIAAQIAAGLAAAHAHGVIHRDIKPGNIMLLDKLQRVKITDFGLARVALDNAELTSGEMGIGTPTYMSPEQVKGGKIDARSDLFSLGCVMYAMLRGHSPFQGATPLEVARKVVDGDPSPPPADENVPGFLTDIIERLLEKSPDNRYQSAAEVADVLRRHLAMINQTPTSKLTELLRPRTKRRQIAAWLPLLAATALVMLSAAAISAWRLGGSGRPQPEQPFQTLIPSGLAGA